MHKHKVLGPGTTRHPSIEFINYYYSQENNDVEIIILDFIGKVGAVCLPYLPYRLQQRSPGSSTCSKHFA